MQLSIIDGLHHVDRDDWNALTSSSVLGRHPFVQYDFLKLLEDSGSVGLDDDTGQHSGWHPLHVLVHDDDGKLLGACPTYLKEHSYGEYIFDWSWANAIERMGVPYYPKIVVGIPFTPATGPRLLLHPDADGDVVKALLAEGLKAAAAELKASSVHVLFCLDDELAAFEDAGFFRRATHQFHWRNDQPHYDDVDAFLAQLRSQNRKQIRKERRVVDESGLLVERVRQGALHQGDYERLFQLYRSTTDRKWGQAYLTRAFFDGLAGAGGQDALVNTARDDDGALVAMALSFTSEQHIYGRYWGALHADRGRRQEQLHFELCYYQLLEHAIVHGMDLVEAGAQGEHKIKRGFLPVVTHSAHFIVEPQLHDAIGRAMNLERQEVEHEVESGRIRGPFKEGCVPPHPLRAGCVLRDS